MTPIVLVLSVLLAAPAVSSAEGGSAEYPAALAVADAGSSASRATDSGPAWEERVIWHCGQEGREAYFIPQRALDGLALEELPIGEDMALLRRAFRLDKRLEDPERSDDEEEGSTDCFSFTQAYCALPGPASSLQAAVRTSGLSFLGRAVQRVPGLLPGGPDAADMVYLEVVKILRDATGQIGTGQVLGLIEAADRVWVGGLPLCSYKAVPEAAIMPGDLVLIVGRLHEEVAEVVQAWLRFPVEEGLIQPGPFAAVLDQLPMPLTELVASLAPGAPDPSRPSFADLQRSEPASGDSAYAERIVWNPKVPGEALFVPRAILEATPVAELPLADLSKLWLLWQVGLAEAPDLWWAQGKMNPERWRREQRARKTEPIRDCEVPRILFRVSRASGGGGPIAKRLQFQDAAFLGTVAAVVPGWAGAPVEIVYLRVDEILRDHKGVLTVGQVIHQFRPAGEVVVAGRTFCAERDAWEIETRPGDTVLIGGHLDGRSGRLFATFEFLVRDGLIQNRPASGTSDRLPMPLAELREQFYGGQFSLLSRADE